MARWDIISDELRACTTIAGVDAVSDMHRAEVLAMYDNPETRVRALHISNLKAYRRWEIRNG